MFGGTMAVHRSAEYWSLGIDFLASGNYIAVNRSLIKVFGLDGAVLIGELASEAKYWNDRDKLEDGWFFSTIENVEEATGLSGYQQRKALSELTKAGVVETTQKGIPKKRYIRIRFMELVNLVNDKSLKNSTTVGEETSPLESEKVDINNNKEQQQPTTKKKERKKPAETYDSIIDSYTENGELRSALVEFVKMRKMMKKPLTNKALSLLLTSKKGLDGLASNDAEKIDIVQQSIMRGWQGFFPLKDIEAKKNTAPHETSSGFNRKIDADYYYQSSGDEELDKVLGLGKYAPKRN